MDLCLRGTPSLIGTQQVADSLVVREIFRHSCECLIGAGRRMAVAALKHGESSTFLRADAV